jgi:hypothetical protein
MSQLRVPEDAKFLLPGLLLGAAILLTLIMVAAVFGMRSGFYGLWPDVGAP